VIHLLPDKYTYIVVRLMLLVHLYLGLAMMGDILRTYQMYMLSTNKTTGVYSATINK